MHPSNIGWEDKGDVCRVLGAGLVIFEIPPFPAKIQRRIATLEDRAYRLDDARVEEEKEVADNALDGTGGQEEEEVISGAHKLTQPPMGVCKMEAQLEYVCTRCILILACLGADLHAQSVLSNKISASELKRKFIKSALLVV